MRIPPFVLAGFWMSVAACAGEVVFESDTNASRGASGLGGMPDDAVCPETKPQAGATCTVPGDLTCNYEQQPAGTGCDYLATCAEGRWRIVDPCG
jgi:hypothetical protein